MMVTGYRLMRTVRPSNGPVAVEVVLPQPVADDRRERLGSYRRIRRGERAAENWLHGEEIEVVSGDAVEPRGIGNLRRCQLRREPVGSPLTRICLERGYLEVPAVGIRNVREPGCRWRGRILEDGEFAVVVNR